jgi:hypothetical protein
MLDDGRARQGYDSRLYIERKTITAAIARWLDNPNGKKIFCLTAPPGSGKTWILERVHDLARNHFSQCQVVLWLEVPCLVDAASDPSNPQFFPAKIETWLTEAYIQAGIGFKISYLPAFNPLMDYSASIQQLVEIVCGGDAHCKVLLIVDGYDEVPETHQEFFADTVLVPFNLKECTRTLIAYRDQSGFSQLELRLNQEIFPLADNDPLNPVEQFEGFRREYRHGLAGAPQVQFEDLRRQLVYYQWKNPFANYFLFDKALARVDGALIDFQSDTIKACIHALLERPYTDLDDAQIRLRYPQIEENDYQKLVKLADLGEDFTVEEIARELHIAVFTDEFIKNLISLYGVLLYVEGTQKYRLVDSIRTLLVDEKTLRGKEPRP